MGLAALGIGPGDEVILADINWIASAAPITYLGAKPVFVDVLPDTWCIDPAEVEAAITPRTKAIIAVHLYGNLCDMDALLDIGERHGIPSSRTPPKRSARSGTASAPGSMGTFGAFSFHGTKTVTTGEGGMFVTNDDALYERVLTLSNHGRARAKAGSSGRSVSASNTRCPTCRRRSAARRWSASTNWSRASDVFSSTTPELCGSCR